MSNQILTIITYSISNNILRKDFTTFLETDCHARKVVNQSTYVSPLEREDVILKISLKKNYVFDNDDHVTLYYCQGSNANSNLPLTEQVVVEPKVKS